MPFSILGLGTVVVDHQVRLQLLPEPDTKAEVLFGLLSSGGSSADVFGVVISLWS